MNKNVASQKIQLFAFDVSTGLPKTGDAANLTAYVSKDHGAVTVLGDTSAAEMDATNAKGVYVFDLTQGETNADELTFTAKSTTSNVSITPRFIATTPAGFTSQVAQTGDNYARLGAPVGASISADIATVPAAAASAVGLHVVEGTLTLDQILKLLAAVAVGNTSIVDLGGGSATVEFEAADGATVRVSATMTGSERTAVVLTP